MRVSGLLSSFVHGKDRDAGWAGTNVVRAFWDTAREFDPERAAAADEDVVMRWCADGELAELWRLTGLGDVRFGALVVRAPRAPDDLRDRSGPT